MGLLVCAGDVLSVPAAREHELEANTVGAVRIEILLVGKEVAIERTFRGDSVVEAIESKSSLTKECLGVVWCDIPERLLDIRNRVGEVALVGISSNHLKTSGEGG